MSAQPLDDKPVYAPKYALVGVYTDGTTLVRHVAILREAVSVLRRGDTVPVYHVRPGAPFQDVLSVHLIAILPGLSPAAIDDGAKWIDEMTTLVATIPGGIWSEASYIAHPPRDTDPQSGRLKYSCIGLVLHFYEKMGQQLLEHVSLLPELFRAHLDEIYGQQPEDYYTSIGIPLKDEPWRVTMPGYAFHACNSATPQLPYRPSSPDERAFP